MAGQRQHNVVAELGRHPAAVCVDTSTHAGWCQAEWFVPAHATMQLAGTLTILVSEEQATSKHSDCTGLKYLRVAWAQSDRSARASCCVCPYCMAQGMESGRQTEMPVGLYASIHNLLILDKHTDLKLKIGWNTAGRSLTAFRLSGSAPGYTGTGAAAPCSGSAYVLGASSCHWLLVLPA